MLRGAFGAADNPTVLVGVTEENVRRLKAGHPIDLPLRDFGIDAPGRILVAYGHTAGDLCRELKRSGVPISNVQSDPRAQAFENALAENPRVLVATVGLPRSGKSTWCREQGWPIVNPDSIRLAIHGHRFIAEAEPFVWATAKAMVRALFLAGHNVVLLDACNTSRKRRDEWRDEFWRLYFQPVETSQRECIARAMAEGDEEIVNVLERMASLYEPLGADEEVWP